MNALWNYEISEDGEYILSCFNRKKKEWEYRAFKAFANMKAFLRSRGYIIKSKI